MDQKKAAQLYKEIVELARCLECIFGVRKWKDGTLYGGIETSCTHSWGFGLLMDDNRLTAATSETWEDWEMWDIVVS